MRPLITVALLGLLVYYVSGRAIILENDSNNEGNSAEYDACMLQCENVRDGCIDECGNGYDEEAVNCRNACASTYNTCTTGSSAEDENIPYYKRVVKRNCQDHLKRDQTDTAPQKDEIDYEFIMRQ